MCRSELPLVSIPDVMLSPIACFKHILTDSAPDTAEVLDTLTAMVRQRMADALESCPPCVRSIKLRDDGFGWRCCGLCCKHGDKGSV